MKLPVLVGHFMEHHQLDHNVGFVDFLAMHYWGTDLNDDDNDRDMQLPFKNVSLHFSDSAVPHFKSALAQHPTFSNLVIQHVFDNDDLPQPALGSLFRPPRA